MKIFAKTLLAGGALLAAGTASAASIDIGISYDPNAEANFTSLLKPGYLTENFDGWSTQGSGPSTTGNDHEKWVDSASSFSTNVGDFTLTEAGQDDLGYLPVSDGDNLKIESNQTGEYGREALASDENDFWLDSNDAREVEWDFNSAGMAGKSYDAFGFYVADPADVAAQLTLKFENGDSDQFTIPFGQDDADVGYVTVKSELSVVGGKLTFDNSAGNDGWGIDDIAVGKLPEPGTLLLMGLGLLGLGAARRRVAK